MKTVAIIPSGGQGSRISTSLPKQYIKFDDKELIVYTLEVFQNCDLIDEIIIAAEPDYFEIINVLKDRYHLSKISLIVEGGKERQDSVCNAVFAIDANENDLVAVHDAARPLLPIEILNSAIASAKTFDNIVVAIKARDTLIKGSDFVIDYIDRDEIYYAQTPQIFRFGILKDSLQKAINDNFYGTDESMIVKRASYSVKIVKGSSINFKVTTESDMKLFEMISTSL